MRRIRVRLETRSLSRERGKYGREDETAALNGILPSFMRRAFYRVGGMGATFSTFSSDQSAVIRSDGFQLCESPQS